MNDELIDLAQSTQRRHAELIEKARDFPTYEARLQVRNELDTLRQEFTERALDLTDVRAPYLWLPENPQHAVALAVRNDIADTEMRLANLANNAAFFKLIKSNYGSGINIPKFPDLDIPLGIVGVVLVLVAILVLRR